MSTPKLQPCRGCNAPIYWERTPAGKWTCLNPDGETHWATCPDAQRFKGRGKQAPPLELVQPDDAEELPRSLVLRDSQGTDGAGSASALDACARCHKPLSLIWIELRGMNGVAAICDRCWIEDSTVFESKRKGRSQAHEAPKTGIDEPGFGLFG